MELYGDGGKQAKMCYFWKTGKCTRVPCAFLHVDLLCPPPSSNRGKRRLSVGGGDGDIAGSDGNKRRRRRLDSVCKYWTQGICSYGEKCRFLHSSSLGDDLIEGESSDVENATVTKQITVGRTNDKGETTAGKGVTDDNASVPV